MPPLLLTLALALARPTPALADDYRRSGAQKARSSTADFSIQPRQEAFSGGTLLTAVGARSSETNNGAGRNSPYVFGPGGGSPAEYEAYLNAGNAASPTACEQRGFPAEFRQNCLSRHSTLKRAELYSSLASCSWLAVDTAIGASVNWQRPAPTPRKEDWTPVHGARLERCTLESSQPIAGDPNPLGHFEAVRFGPITTHGGKDWTQFRAVEFAFGATWPDAGHGGERAIAVREAYAGAIDANGALLGYPPLHQHHFHIFEKRELNDNHAIITHGDDNCLESMGGLDCTIRRMIPGYATIVRQPITMDVIMNDVRAKGSSPLTYYLLATIRGMPHDGTFKSFTVSCELPHQLPPPGTSPHL